MNRLIQKLKKYFIPHPENDHKPHILRRAAVEFVVLVALVVELTFLFGTSVVVPRSRYFGAILANALVDGTNQNRIVNNVPALHMNPLLQGAAQKKADDMAKNGYFAHTSPAGVTPWYWFEQAGYHFTYAGENLAVNFSDSQDVVDAWMNSPGHRKNILDGNFTEIGIAMATGEYKSQPATFVVEFFGTPAPAPVSIASTAPKVPVAKKAPAPTVVARNASRSTSSEQTFVAVKGAEVQAQAAAADSTAPKPVAPQNNQVQNAIAAPRHLVNGFYLLLMGLFALALALHVFIKIRIQHPKLILSGTLVIAVAALFIVMNQHLALLGAAVL